MLKRAFLSGLLATGIDIVDLLNAPSNVTRHCLAKDNDISAAIHFRQSVKDPTLTEIIFYTSEGLVIDSKLAKSIERIFFRENFRKVYFNEIGEIFEDSRAKERYMNAVLEKIDQSIFKKSEIKIATDIMLGSTSDIYPRLMNELGIENIILNAYKDEKNLSKVANNINKSQKNMENIVKVMQLDCGFLIYPNGQKLQLIDDEGNLVYDYKLLLVILTMLNNIAQKRVKVLLPAWGPDFMEFKNIDITYAKLSSFKATQLQEFDLIASTDGHFAFFEFGLNSDAVFSSFKILELITKTNMKISKIIKDLPYFVFKGENVPCPSEYKGKMMRKFLEEANGKESNSIDGVKIWTDEDEWILMVPDEHAEYLNIYIQAQNHKNASKIFWNYQNKIETWLNE